MDTNHSFVPSKLNALLCASCYRPAESHSTDTNKPTCESCSNQDKLTDVNGIWMCPDCLSKELEIASEPKTTIGIPKPSGPEFVKSAVSYMSNQINKDHEPVNKQNEAINALGSQSISRSEDFFNARTIAISDRWATIVADDSIENENKHYQLAKEVREHYLHLKEVLFKTIETQLEITSHQRANQIYLNQLASKLREEERVKLHLANIDYIPPTPKATPKVKVNKDDKIAADYARIMGIPIETARRLIGNKLKEVVGDCTCAETPGICKIHSK